MIGLVTICFLAMLVNIVSRKINVTKLMFAKLDVTICHGMFHNIFIFCMGYNLVKISTHNNFEYFLVSSFKMKQYCN